MKKIIVLTMLVLLAIGTPVLAGDLTFGGDFNIESGSNFKEGYADKFDFSLDVSAVADEYNTVSFEFELDHIGFADPDAAGLPTAYPLIGAVDNPKLTTDVGAAMGLADFGVGVVVNSGIFESASQEYACITSYEIEDVAYVEAALHGGAEVVLTFADMVNVQLASDFDGAAKNWLVGAFGTVGPVSAELYYACEGDAMADGQLIVDGAFSQELGMVALDVAAGFWYDLAGDEDAAVPSTEYMYGVGVAAAADVGVAVSGDVALMGTSMEDHILEAVGIGLGVDPMADLGVDVGIYLNTYTKPTGDDTPMLDHIDFSVWKTLGIAEYRVGYLYAGDETAKYTGGNSMLNAPMSAAQIDGGGAYIVVDINY